jgi:hypothetical protein
MENEKIIEILTEVLEEQKEMNRSQTEVLKAVKEQKNNTDTVSVQNSIDKVISEMKLLVEISKPKPQSNNLRIFLESDAKKWAVYLLVAFTFLTYLYLYAIRKL